MREHINDNEKVAGNSYADSTGSVNPATQPCRTCENLSENCGSLWCVRIDDHVRGDWTGCRLWKRAENI